MSILGLLNQAITLSTKSGRGADGRPSFNTGATVMARIEVKTKRVLLPDGTMLTIDAIVFVAGDTSVNTDDKINYDDVDYKVIDVFKVPDDAGNTNHKELRLARWPST